MGRFLLFFAVLAATALAFWSALQNPWVWAVAVPLALLSVIGLFDLVQTRHTLWRNFPLLGRLRWIGEELRPFFRAYFVESDTEGRPFNHEERAMVYRRAKNVSSVEPFGSHVDIGKPPYEWLSHSLNAQVPVDHDPRIAVGAGRCAKPYDASLLNISAMSFGALGAKATEALNRGAAKGGFYHDTGEGGVSKFHKKGGGDLVWELGSGYFGARKKDGTFDPVQFQETASLDQIKMIEIKLSQGAKPGHGGVLPGSKVTRQIAKARGVEVGETCISPPRHSAFSTPLELMEFVAKLRELSGGKPVGIKLCIGNRWELFAIVKAMLQAGDRIDFIVVDGAEGGTGAAPAEFLDHIGMPLRQGLVFARNALVGAGIKDEVRLAASGKLISAYSIAASMALGADWVNTARGFMLALGCIQSLHCHENTCPTGIATTSASHQRGLVVKDKAERVYHFHKNTVHALMEVAGAAGCCHPKELTPRHLMLMNEGEIATPGHLAYKLIEPGALVAAPDSTHCDKEWAMARADSFEPATAVA
ncbi:MAG: glutamate synthase-related protein [Pseudomonadota bacterium]